MARVIFDENILVSEESEVKGQKEFSFWQVITGLFGDLKEFSEELNVAVDAAYLEKL